MRITWTPPDNNGLAVTQYEILVEQADGSFSATSACDGSNSTLVSQAYCDIPMLTLRQTPYTLVLNSPVKAKIRAYNLIGWGQFSTVTTSWQLITTEPRAPPSSPDRGASTNDNLIHVTWQQLTGDTTGNEPITIYWLYWDQGTGTDWYILKIEDSSLGPFTYTHQQSYGIVAGQSYQVKYKATNKHGTGDYSPVKIIKACGVPDQLNPVTTSLSGSTLTVNWAATPSDRGCPVTKYRVKFRQQNGDYTESSACNGQDSGVISSRSCSFDINTLTTGPYTLSSGDAVIASVEAWNEIGYSTPSLDNSGGTTIP